jgi:hypothetical protein
MPALSKAANSDTLLPEARAIKKTVFLRRQKLSTGLLENLGERINFRTLSKSHFGICLGIGGFSKKNPFVKSVKGNLFSSNSADILSGSERAFL